MNFKKPDFWDQKKPNLLSYLLLPFTIPIRISNFLLKFKNIKKTNKIKSICVGNIYLGGTGKTPTTIKIYDICKKLNQKTVVGKKHYRSQIDEQIILKNKTNIISKKNRNEIIQTAIENDFEIIIFDDGLQDKSIDYDLKIVCFDIETWIGNGCLLPSGPLREKISSLEKYDVVFLKNENFKINEITKEIKKNNPNIMIFHTFYEPVNLKNFDIDENYIVFSGIGNPDSFIGILKENKFKIVKQIIFPDHYNYKNEDIKKIKLLAKNMKAKILTTEKDYVKLSEIDQKEIDFLEISLKFKNEENFVNYIKLKINEKY